MDIPFFTHDELACPSTGEVKLAYGFAEKLVKLRMEFGRPMPVNSCCRSEEHNRTMEPKGHPRSLHVYDHPYHKTDGAAAIDISTRSYTPADVVRLIDLGWRRGWSVGVAKTFIHLDRRVDFGLPQNFYVY